MIVLFFDFDFNVGEMAFLPFEILAEKYKKSKKRKRRVSRLRLGAQRSESTIYIKNRRPMMEVMTTATC